MLMSIKQILFSLLYVIIMMIILLKTGPKLDNDKKEEDREQRKISIIMTIIPLVIIGVVSYCLFFK